MLYDTTCQDAHELWSNVQSKCSTGTTWNVFDLQSDTQTVQHTLLGYTRLPMMTP
jgi:hypothetical protein